MNEEVSHQRGKSKTREAAAGGEAAANVNKTQGQAPAGEDQHIYKAGTSRRRPAQTTRQQQATHETRAWHLQGRHQQAKTSTYIKPAAGDPHDHIMA